MALLEQPLLLGFTLLAQGEWLPQTAAATTRTLFDEAAQIFERLRATPLVERRD